MKDKEMKAEEQASEMQEPEMNEHEGEDGYGSVEDEEEKAAVDKKEVISNSG